jgi:AcrR family transcriptional regulator
MVTVGSGPQIGWTHWKVTDRFLCVKPWTMQLREPQQARAHATRARLVEAAAECLSASGYQGTTTQSVAVRAGVSQGALFKHFPSKASLLSASVAHVLGRLVVAFANDPALSTITLLPIEQRIGPAVRALFKIFRRDEMQAVFEVYMAARTEPSLGEALGPILEHHRLRILEQADKIFPEMASAPAFAPAVDAVVYAMQGVIIGMFTADDRAEAHHLAFFERLARNELAFALRAPGEAV